MWVCEYACALIDSVNEINSVKKGLSSNEACLFITFADKKKYIEFLYIYIYIYIYTL